MAVGDVYTAYAIEKFGRAEAKASGHTVTIFHRIHETFEVITALHGFHMDKGRNKQVVKLNEGTCSCNKWQSFGIPCSHVLVVYAHMRIDSWQFVEKYYRLDAYAFVTLLNLISFLMNLIGRILIFLFSTLTQLR